MTLFSTHRRTVLWRIISIVLYCPVILCEKSVFITCGVDFNSALCLSSCNEFPQISFSKHKEESRVSRDMSTFLKVFCYGTLKRGEPNHHWFTNPEHGIYKFVGRGSTSEKYPLVIASKYNIPFLLDVPGTGHNVKGEVYEVDNLMLSNLDILEGYPDYYTRREERIILADDTETEVKCWTYFLVKHRPSLLELPMLKSYSSSGDHGLVYMERYRRDPDHNHKAEVSLNHDKKSD